MKIILALILFAGIVSGQTRTNLEIYYTLLDSVLTEVAGKITSSGTDSTFYFDAGQMNQVLYSRVLSEMSRKNLSSASLQEADIVLVIENALVTYGDMFRDGFLGSFHMPRNIEFQGNYLLKSNNFVRNFNFTHKDTVAVDSTGYIENQFYPFTKGDIPSEPFFSSLLEPVIAIGSTAVVVVLFFTIRSK